MDISAPVLSPWELSGSRIRFSKYEYSSADSSERSPKDTLPEQAAQTANQKDFPHFRHNYYRIVGGP